MRVYLDNCSYNRPFDPSGQTRIQVETICKLAVQFLMATRKVEYVWSEMLDYEVSRNPSNPVLNSKTHHDVSPSNCES